MPINFFAGKASDSKLPTDQKPAVDVPTLVLSTAESKFYEKGFHGVSLRVISNEIGLHAGSLYYHFHNKEDILYTLIDTYESALANTTTKIKKNDPAKMLEIFTDRYIDFSINNRASSQISLFDFKNMSSEHQTEILQTRLRVKNFFSKILDDGRKQNIFNFEHLAPTVHASFMILSQASYHEPSTIDVKQTSKAAINRIIGRLNSR